MNKELTLTKEDKEEIKRLVKMNPALIKKLQNAFEKNYAEIHSKNANGILIKPHETASATIASLTSRMKPGSEVSIDTGEIVFVGACVFVA